MSKATLFRLGLFLAVALIHGVALFYLVIYIEPSQNNEEAPLTVMKLLDIQEELPPPPLFLPPPPPPPPRPSEPLPPAAANMVETIAENMTVVEEVPEEQVLAAPGTILPVTVPFSSSASESDGYLPQNKISKVPVFPEEAIRRVLTYPPIAQRSGIEGSVILELFIDRTGVIQRAVILRESPPGRGFGDAAVKALLGQECIPAESNGVAVAVRYRYPVRFKLR
jgi:protein TonB